MRICLVLEGSYPYVHGGVSTWMHAYIQAMPQQEFSLWVIGAKAQDRGKFVYELPPNVKEVEEVFLDDALRHGRVLDDMPGEGVQQVVVAVEKHSEGCLVAAAHHHDKLRIP